MRSRLAVLLAAAVLPIAGCGSSDSASDAGADPAKVVPADAPLYVELVVRPDGELRDGAEDALKKILRTDDPAKKVVDLFNQVAGDEDVTWDEVKQWLGPRVGLFVTEFSGEIPTVAVVFDQTDADKAKATLDRLTEGEPDTETAIIGDYAVIGTPAGVQAVQATADGGRPLTDVADYSAARDAIGADEDLAVVYVEPQGIVDAISQAASGMEDSPFSSDQALDVFRQIFAKAGRAAAVGFHADGGALRIEAAAIGAEAGQSTDAASASLAGLPSDAWLAVGFGDLGKTLTNALAQIEQLAGVAGEAGPDFEGLFRQFERKTGVNVREDFLSWMGDGAIYARGRSIADIGAVLTVKTKNAEKSRKAVGILAQGIQSAGAQVREASVEGYDVAVEIRNAEIPVSLFIAANDERFSLGINPQALAAVNDPPETLGDSEAYGKAKEALGDLAPVALIDTPTIINMLETFGLSEVDGYAMVKPYLEAIGPISAGAARDGDVSRFSLAVGLR